MLTKIWVYKEGSEPKVIPLTSLKAEKKAGWSDWPHFTPEMFGMTAGQNLDELGDIVETIRNSVNQALNIDTLDEFELRAYARDGLNIDVDYLEGAEALRERIKAA